MLLASMWYIASSWIYLRSCINEIKRLIKNYLLAGKVEETRAKVAWSTIVLSWNKGDLGLVDPLRQSKGLVSKFIVRSLLRRGDLRKNYL